MRRRLWLGLVWSGLVAVIGGGGCAKVGPPVPPARFTLAAASDVTATQYGAQIVVRFTKPAQAVRADIFRRVEPRDALPALPEEVFLREARLIGSLDDKALAVTTSPAYTDQFDPQDPGWATKCARYAVRLVDARGRPSPLSGYAVVYPSAAVAQPPCDLRAEVTQAVIHLTWHVPVQNLDGSPVTEVRFNVYRRRTDGGPASRRNSAPLPTPDFADGDFVFGEEYEYVVRAVSLVRGELIESQASPPLRVRPVDTFPPAAPTNVTAASAAGLVSVFFPANTETDLRGYVIYRSEVGEDEPPVRLTPTPIQRTTFQDRTGVGGRVYRYVVTAVDVFGNESAPSNAVEVEVVP